MITSAVTFIRKNIHEIGGSLGDLGILLPLAIILIINNGLSSTTVFCFIGIHYLITGYYFKIPLPIQPLKAMAIIAIAMDATPQLIGATGILMGAILLLLAIGKLSSLIEKLFSKAIIRGIQLAVGLFLTEKGFSLITSPSATITRINFSADNYWLSIMLATGTGLLILYLSRYKKIPATLIILPISCLISYIFTAENMLPTLSSHINLPTLIIPTRDDFIIAFFLMVIPQIPLTLANSITSTHQIARDYYAERAKRVTPKALCTSLGAANLIGGFFGALPCCHGAGGLTAHYRFGARTGMSTIILGLLFLGSGLIFGDTVYALFTLIPFSVLGALLIYVGIEHCMMIKDVLSQRQTAFVSLLIAAISIASHNIAIGFAVGMVVTLLIKQFPDILTNEDH